LRGPSYVRVWFWRDSALMAGAMAAVTVEAAAEETAVKLAPAAPATPAPHVTPHTAP
jgi:hypothetical protein